MPSSLVRPPLPTYTVPATLSTSPPSSVPGASMCATRYPTSRTAFSAATVSGRRWSAPGRVTTARSAYTTTASSMKALSGQLGSGSASVTCQPAPVSASTYPCHWRIASSGSTGVRSMCVTRPSAIRGLGRRTSAFLDITGASVGGGGHLRTLSRRRAGRTRRRRTASGAAPAALEGVQVPLREQPVVPLLVEHDQQAVLHREAPCRWPPVAVDRLGVRGQGLVGEPVDDRAHGGHPVATQPQHLVEGRAGLPVARDPRGVLHLVPRQVQRVPRRGVAEDRPAHPGIGRERQVPQRLGERPLAVDRLVQQGRLEPAGALDRAVPEPLEDVPRLT